MKNCETCSFYMVDEDILNLSPDDQIIFEHIQDALTSDDAEIDYLTLNRLLKGIRRVTCIGGLNASGEPIKNCKYHDSNLPKDLTKDQLLQILRDKRSTRSSKKIWVISILFSIITITLTIVGLLQNADKKELKIENKNLEDIQLKQRAEIIRLEAQVKSDSITIIKLKETIENNISQFKLNSNE